MKLCKDDTGPNPDIVQNPLIYQPKDATVPNVQCVYLLVSTKLIDYTYIGETTDLSSCLYQHNMGRGASGTRIKLLQLWALLAYVIGFNSKQSIQRFETLWKLKSRQQRQHRGIYANILVEYAQCLINQLKLRYNDKN